MKVFTVIFIVYLFLLSITPCVERGSCSDAHAIANTLPAGHDDHDDGGCTPFCGCACCHNVIVVSDLMHISSPGVFVAYHSQPSVSYISSLQHSIAAEIFQPPRIV